MNIKVNTSIVDLNEAIAFYSDDLPNPNILNDKLCHLEDQMASKIVQKQLGTH